MDTPMHTTESALLMLSLRPRLMLTPTFFMEDMDILDMLDIMDTPMPTTDYTLASVLLMLSLRPRLMLILTFSIEDMDILDMLDTTDIPMPTMDIMASVLLMLTPTFLWRIWIWTSWICRILRISLWWICLLGISCNHQSNILLQKMDKTTINVFFFSDIIFSA